MSGSQNHFLFLAGETVYRVEWTGNMASMREYIVVSFDGHVLLLREGLDVIAVEGATQHAFLCREKTAAATAALQSLAIESTQHLRSYSTIRERSHELAELLSALNAGESDSSANT